MQDINLSDEIYSIEHNGLIRICILDGDILINSKFLPSKILLYFKGNVELKGTGKVRYNLGY